jgi:hypothetical protein
MRSTILSRSAVVVASLVVTAAALAATPAQAATASGITRDMVLQASGGIRIAPATSSTIFGGGIYDPATNRALRAMVNRTCAIDPDGPEIGIGSIAASTVAGASAEGVVVTAVIYNMDTVTSGSGTPEGRVCTFGALAPVALRSVLTGIATLTGAPTAPLSGDVFVTSPAMTSLEDYMSGPETFPTFAASGATVQSDQVKVADKKTSKQKKAAKATYTKRLKAAKKAYTKALKKAGNSKSKKSAAKKAYSAKKSSAKAAYRAAIAEQKIVTRNTSTPFTVSAQYAYPPSAP